jgi:hypothetical protein
LDIAYEKLGIMEMYLESGLADFNSNLNLNNT